MDDQFDDIMERIRARQNEVPDDVKENDTYTSSVVVKQEISESQIQVPASPTKVFGTSLKSSNNEVNTPVVFRPTKNESTPQNADSTSNDTTTNQSTSSNKKSRFSALAQELEDFEFDYTSQYNKPKEAYMKGRSPRMSIGESRAVVFGVPPVVVAKNLNAQPSKSADSFPISSITQSEFEARRIKFAQPIVNVNYLPNESSIFSGSSVNDMSTVLGGSAEMMNVTTSSLSCTEMSMNQQITHENTVINAQSCDNREAILKERQSLSVSTDEYGAHTFMRKKVPKSDATAQPPHIPEEDNNAHTPTSTSSVNTLVSSPKPFSKDIGKSMFSPVHFTPRSTSSPKFKQPEDVMSPSKTAALEGSVAKTRKMQFEQKYQSSYVPVPSAPVPTPRHHVANLVLHKKELIPPKNTTPTATAELPVHVQTQWRGQGNTPVVQGARAEDKTAGPDVLGAGVGKLKNLKSRWEFSSVTGTPIHPDATEDSLIACAKKMQETALPKTIGNRSISGRKGASASSIHSQQQQQTRSTTASPAAKNVRYGNEVFEEDNVFGNEAPENNEEDDPVDDDDDDLVIPEDDTSRIIDHAFGFMEGSGTGTPSPFRSSLDGKAPLARFEGSASPKRLVRKDLLEHQEVIEEEDVPVGGDTDDEEEERTPRGDIKPPPVELQYNESQERDESKPLDTSLPYSVSFYRKKQRERVEEANAPLTPVNPSAPSLTSPQKLRQLTSGHSSGDYSTPPGGRVYEGEREQKERLIKSIRVEEEQVSQSKRALAFSREKPSFRGSREEFESQRALLVHVEKHRALVGEYERLKREGPRIIDAPRGTVEVSQLTVNMAREFVSAHISSTKKPDEVFYFLAVLRYAEQCEVSPMVTSDSALNRKGILEFPMPLKLKEIPADFRATVEIYGQRSMREQTTHEDKFKLKGMTLKNKNADEWCYYVDKSELEARPATPDVKKPALPCRLWRMLHTRNTFLGGSGSSANSSVFVQPSPSCSTNFNLLGSFSFDINCPGKHIYHMSHNVHPLDGAALMKVRKSAVDGADISFSGFLSMYQKTQEFGSWTRYWCVIDNGEMRFWRHPEDETTKRCIVLIDLSTCIRSEGAVPVNDVCPYPNSFQVDVWVPKAGETDETMFSTRGTIEQLRVLLAADTNPDMFKWMSVINATSKQLCTWRNPIIQ